jgi:hypothetical protein
MARKGCERLRNGDGRGLKEDYDVQTWNTLVELGYAPTPMSGQPAAFRTPREFNPSAATPPLVYSTALAAKQTPSSAPEGPSPHLRMLSAAKLLGRTPAHKRSLSDALASAAAESCRQAAAAKRGRRSEGPDREPAMPPSHSAMAMLAAVANSEEALPHAEPSTPVSDVVRLHSEPVSQDRDDLDASCSRPLFISPLQALPSPQPCAMSASGGKQAGDVSIISPPHSPRGASPSDSLLQATFSLPHRVLPGMSCLMQPALQPSSGTEVRVLCDG